MAENFLRACLYMRESNFTRPFSRAIFVSRSIVLSSNILLAARSILLFSNMFASNEVSVTQDNIDIELHVYP